MSTKSVLCAIGTRPEVIKMAPVIRALEDQPGLRCRVLVTAQHRDLLDQMLDYFQIQTHMDLDAMRSNQTLADLTARLLTGLDKAIEAERPDLVLAQGDTTTVLASALASFYRRVPFGHVEAGLRTGSMDSPFPEEANRVLVSRIARIHFAPTAEARDHLLHEGVPAEAIHLTGNSVIDALLWAAAQSEKLTVASQPDRRLILVTAHRRDSFGEPIKNICKAIATLSTTRDDVEFLWPVHPNPAIKPVVEGSLGELPGVRLCAPLSYGDFVAALRSCYLVLTDSGGVQEEAPALGKPVLVMRAESERPEAIRAGVARLVGTNPDEIIRQTMELLDNPLHYKRMSTGGSPYGDGHAATRIAEAVTAFLSVGIADRNSRRVA